MVDKHFHAWNREGFPIWIQSTIVPVDYSIIGDAGPRAAGFQLHRHEGIQLADAVSLLPPHLSQACSDLCVDVPIPGVTSDLFAGPPAYDIVGEGAHSVVAVGGSRQEVLEGEVQSVIEASGTIELIDRESDMEHVHGFPEEA